MRGILCKPLRHGIIKLHQGNIVNETLYLCIEDEEGWLDCQPIDRYNSPMCFRFGNMSDEDICRWQWNEVFKLFSNLKGID